MNTYRVHLTKTISTSVTVTAEDDEAAIEAAEMSEDLPPERCAQCSGYGRDWYIEEDGMWEVPEPSSDYVEEV